jgi:hypothetical protein
MTGASRVRALLIVLMMTLALASPVLADTCCANLPVKLVPSSVDPGDTVRLVGLRCLRSDGSGPLPLNLGAFWLAKGHRPAEDPRDAPGNLPYPDLPPIERWLSFESAPTFDSTTHGDATIVVPDLPDGLYQLWWWCDNGGGPGSGIHYSTGQRLAVGVPPDTATELAPDAPGHAPNEPVAALLVLAGTVLILTLRRRPRPSDGR